MIESQITGQICTIPTKLYRVGELVRYTPFSRQTIHNYTTMGLIREAEWTQGGHRLYDQSVFERLSRIIELRKTKTLDQIRRILNREDAAADTRRSHKRNHAAGKHPKSEINLPDGDMNSATLN